MRKLGNERRKARSEPYYRQMGKTFTTLISGALALTAAIVLSCPAAALESGKQDASGIAESKTEQLPAALKGDTEIEKLTTAYLEAQSGIGSAKKEIRTPTKSGQPFRSSYYAAMLHSSSATSCNQTRLPCSSHSSRRNRSATS